MKSLSLTKHELAPDPATLPLMHPPPFARDYRSGALEHHRRNLNSGPQRVDRLVLLELVGAAGALTRCLLRGGLTGGRSNFLKAIELELITSYIAGSKAAKKEFLDIHGATFFCTIVGFLNKVGTD